MTNEQKMHIKREIKFTFKIQSKIKSYFNYETLCFTESLVNLLFLIIIIFHYDYAESLIGIIFE